MGTNHVKEVTVVRNDNHGAITLVQHLLQPANGIDVQVVGRFVEQENVRVGKQRLRQQHTQLPAGCNFAHRAVVLLYWNTHAKQQFTGASFRRVTVHFAVFHFQIGYFIAIFFAHFRQSIDAVALLLHFPQLFMPHDHRIQHGVLFKGKLILTQFTNALIWIDRNVAQRRLKVAAEDLHKGGFTTTVGANQAVTVAAAKFDGNVFKQRLTAELHGDVTGN